MRRKIPSPTAALWINTTTVSTRDTLTHALWLESIAPRPNRGPLSVFLRIFSSHSFQLRRRHFPRLFVTLSSSCNRACRRIHQHTSQSLSSLLPFRQLPCLASLHRPKLNMRRDRNRLSPTIPNTISSHNASGPAHIVSPRSTIHRIRLQPQMNH